MLRVDRADNKMSSSEEKMAACDDYAEAYHVYNNYSDLSSKTGFWLRENINNIVSMVPSRSSEKALKILSIGTGSGDIDNIIIKELMTRNHIEYTAVEPNAQQLKNFRAHVVNNPEYRRVTFTLHEMTADKYLDEVKETDQYHLIHMVHCLYYFRENVTDTLYGLYELLAPGGVILAITNSGIGGNEKVLSEFQGLLPAGGETHAEDVEVILNDLGLTYSKEEVKVKEDIGPLMKDDKVGNLFLDFLSNQHNCRQVTPPDIVKLFLDRMREGATCEDGQLMLYNTMVVHKIQKPTNI